MIELLLVVSLIGILSGIAVPSLIRARGVAAEVSTIGSLQALNTAQAAYASACGGGFYAPSIPWLARPPSPGRPGFIGPEFTANLTNRLGYNIRYTAGTRVATAPATCNGLARGRTVRSYFIAADPVQVGQLRFFGTSASSTIYQSRIRVRAFYSGSPPALAVPPAPARPIQ